MADKVKKPSSPKATLDLKKQVDELTKALVQERADAVNLRRRQEQEITGLKTKTRAQVLRELLPAVDNLERSLKHVPKHLENDAYVKGVLSVVKQFEDTLNKMGIKKIPSVGQPFNPHYHEAIGLEEGDGDHEVVASELQPGYILGDEVIRHAIVKVKRI